MPAAFYPAFKGARACTVSLVPNVNLTGAAIKSLFADLLAGTAGGCWTRWRTLIGKVLVPRMASNMKGY
jgi:hypothetical protein